MIKIGSARNMGRRALALLLAVFAAIGVGEIAFRIRDHGGFPHLNNYVSDPVFGVRLRPNSQATLNYKSNSPVSAHINQAGYRGKAWPQRGSANEIAVIGDSQVFGLGVSDSQTMPAALAEISGRPVLNMGIPTYGPSEYLLEIDEVAKRRPKDVVLVINFGNDIFELGHPNVQRHVVLDGWALSGGKTPAATAFPGRSLIMRDSHLVFAIRQLISKKSATKAPHAARLLVATAKPPEKPLPIPSVPPGAAELASARKAFESAQDSVYSWAWSLAPVSGLADWRLAIQSLRDGARVGDIVSQSQEEAAVSDIVITADWLREAAMFESNAVGTLRSWLTTHADSTDFAKVNKVIARYDRSKSALEALTGIREGQDSTRSGVFRDVLAQASEKVKAFGGRLTVVGLPLDVQVDPSRFSEYGRPQQDLSATLSLERDLCSDSLSLGVACLDTSPFLKSAGKGVFLNGDPHLTEKGQRTVALELSKILALNSTINASDRLVETSQTPSTLRPHKP